MKEITIPQFSFFRAPISNILPQRSMNLMEVHRLITSEYKSNTDLLRFIAEPGQARAFKATHFDYVTFSGEFSRRNENDLIQHSGLLCLDFDHLENVGYIRTLLLNEPYFETELLFTSPSGDGLKWIIAIDTERATHKDYFMAVSNYLKHTYRIEPDKSGKDTSRACFLCHDPEAFINPKHLLP
jgi:hypothetical protein